MQIKYASSPHKCKLKNTAISRKYAENAYSKCESHMRKTDACAKSEYATKNERIFDKKWSHLQSVPWATKIRPHMRLKTLAYAKHSHMRL